MNVYTGIDKVIRSDELDQEIRDSRKILYHFTPIRDNKLIEDRSFISQFDEAEKQINFNKTVISYNVMTGLNAYFDQSLLNEKMNRLLNYCISREYRFFIELDRKYFIVDSIEKKLLKRDKTEYFNVSFMYTLDVSKISN